jgi:1,2-diacylglycerol 3-beta-glucosyltransferase
MFTIVYLVFLIIQVWLAVLVGYLILLTLASFRAERRTPILQSGKPNQQFAILIPAHNEERLLPGLLKSLNSLDYPRLLYAVYVVADNCTDQTALIATQGMASVHVRTDIENPGKGPALQWMLRRIWDSSRTFDALVILDADSLVTPDFLSIMAARLERGERVIQAYYTVRDPDRAWSGGLRYAALAVLHFLRPQGRMVLGGSVGLKGNGMVFVSEILRQHEWSASITEDIELHMELLLSGERVTFAPDAIVFGEMPNSLASSKSQHMRWERGRLDMSRRYVPKLVGQTWRHMVRGHFQQSYLFLDAILEHLIPPFSILAGFSFLLFLGSLIWAAVSSLSIQFVPPINGIYTSQLSLTLSIVTISGLVIYLVSGLRAVHAPKKIYFTLLYSPIYISWKLIQYLQAYTSRGPQEWVRTRRNEG